MVRSVADGSAPQGGFARPQRAPFWLCAANPGALPLHGRLQNTCSYQAALRLSLPRRGGAGVIEVSRAGGRIAPETAAVRRSRHALGRASGVAAPSV